MIQSFSYCFSNLFHLINKALAHYSAASKHQTFSKFRWTKIIITFSLSTSIYRVNHNNHSSYGKTTVNFSQQPDSKIIFLTTKKIVKFQLYLLPTKIEGIEEKFHFQSQIAYRKASAYWYLLWISQFKICEQVSLLLLK